MTDTMPSETARAPRPEKIAVVDEVKTRLQGSSAALLTEYRGMKVADLAALRAALTTAGGDLKVYKNTLVRFAVRDLDLDIDEAMLTGPTAIAFVDGDAAAVAKALRDFARTNPNLVVKGGILGDAALSADEAGRSPTCPPGRCCSPASPAAWPPRSSASPACSRRCPATSPTASRPSSTRAAPPAPRRRARLPTGRRARRARRTTGPHRRGRRSRRHRPTGPTATRTADGRATRTGRDEALGEGAPADTAPATESASADAAPANDAEAAVPVEGAPAGATTDAPAHGRRGHDRRRPRRRGTHHRGRFGGSERDRGGTRRRDRHRGRGRTGRDHRHA
jgi:large subunit ribosomal protein L10